MSCVTTYVQAVDGKWYAEPSFRGVDTAGRHWFLCFDDDDPPELVLEEKDGKVNKDDARRCLEALGFSFAIAAAGGVSGRQFNSRTRRARSFDVTIYSRIPVPAKYDGVFDARPSGQGCFYGWKL